MSAPRAPSTAAYPAGGALQQQQQDVFYWGPPPGDDPRQEGHNTPPPPGTLQDAVSSTSGLLAHYTPDSATSPNGHLSSATQGGKADGERGPKKSKSRTTFSQEQLQVLHLRFQNQKYLSPQQIRELGSALGLTYKQVKTWFQNQRMKFKRTQKETLWMKKGMCPPHQQNGFQTAPCLNFISSPPPQDYSVSPAWNVVHSLPNVHEGNTSNQSDGGSPNYPNDYSLVYGSPQGFYPVMGGESGAFIGKASGPCYGQQAIGYISQQKMNFYHGFSTSVEYATVKMEDSYPFPEGSSAVATFPGPSFLQQYQTSGAEIGCDP